MKKQFDLYETIKEAVKEALLEVLAQMYGVATLEETEDGEGDDDKKENGTTRPIPIVGPGGFSLRK